MSRQIHFAGEWAAEGRSALERLLHGEDISSQLPQCLICICLRADGRWLYVSNLVGSQEVFSSDTPVGLARALRRHLLRDRQDDGGLPSAGGLPRIRVRRVLDYVRDNIGSDLTVATLAKVVNMSEYHFSREFAKSVGESPHQYVMRCRVKEARRLLRETDLAVGEVSRRVGHNSHSHFTSIFRRFTSMSPTEYRRSLPG